MVGKTNHHSKHLQKSGRKLQEINKFIKSHEVVHFKIYLEYEL